MKEHNVRQNITQFKSFQTLLWRKVGDLTQSWSKTIHVILLVVLLDSNRKKMHLPDQELHTTGLGMWPYQPSLKWFQFWQSSCNWCLPLAVFAVIHYHSLQFDNFCNGQTGKYFRALKMTLGAPGWHSHLGIWLLISTQSRSQSCGIKLHMGPRAQQGVCLGISLSLCPSPRSCSLFLSHIN